MHPCSGPLDWSVFQGFTAAWVFMLWLGCMCDTWCVPGTCKQLGMIDSWLKPSKWHSYASQQRCVSRHNKRCNFALARCIQASSILPHTLEKPRYTSGYTSITLLYWPFQVQYTPTSEVLFWASILLSQALQVLLPRVPVGANSLCLDARCNHSTRVPQTMHIRAQTNRSSL